MRSVLRLIQRLRQQPRHVRDNVAFGVAATFTAMVALVWVMHAPGNFTNPGAAKPAESGTPFFAQFRDSVARQMATVRDAVSSATESSESVTTQTEDADSTSDTPVDITNFTISDENRQQLINTAVVASSTPASTNLETAENELRYVRIATTTGSQSATSSASAIGETSE